MSIEIDAVAIVLMESFGVAFIILAFMFIKQSRRIGGKLEALQEALRKASVMRERSWKPCYSYKWVMNRSLKSRSLVGLLVRSIGPGGFLMVLIWGLSGIIALTFLIILHSAGYILFIALIGAAILLETDALEAYSYVRWVQKVSLDRLVEEDQSYMEIAKEAFEMATIRFLIVGATFALAGPFIPQIFEGLCYGLALYMKYTLFQTTETARNVSLFIAVLIATALPGILFYLPELMGKTLLRKIKVTIRETRKH